MKNQKNKIKEDLLTKIEYEDINEWFNETLNEKELLSLVSVDNYDLD